LVSGPGVPASKVRQDPISLVDIAPTLMATANLPKDGPPLDGRALDWNQPATQPFPIYSETCRTLVSYGWSELRALREGSLKLISATNVELYDLSQDPHEQSPLSDSTQVARLETDLKNFTGGETRQTVLSAIGRAPEPARHELLESLGYIGGGEET